MAELELVNLRKAYAQFAMTGVSLALKQGQIESDPSTSILEPVFYRSPWISVSRAADMIAEHAKDRKNWVHAAGGEATGETLDRMYRGGFNGPLWEYLIR